MVPLVAQGVEHLAAEALGNRVVMVPYVGEAEGYDYFDTLDDNEALIQQWHGKADGRINVWVGLEHMYYATPEACRRAVAMCERYNTGLHTHSNEAEAEIGEAMKRFGCSPIRALDVPTVRRLFRGRRGRRSLPCETRPNR